MAVWRGDDEPSCSAYLMRSGWFQSRRPEGAGRTMWGGASPVASRCQDGALVWALPKLLCRLDSSIGIGLGGSLPRAGF